MQNAVVWFEVVGTDGEKLRKFYTDLFGWNIDGAAGDIDYGLWRPATAASAEASARARMAGRGT